MLNQFGPCHCCGKNNHTVRNILMLAFKSPTPGTGWGCVVCGLPADGASSILCDECIENEKQPKLIFKGYAADIETVPIDEIKKIPFDHDWSLHD